MGALQSVPDAQALRAVQPAWAALRVEERLAALAALVDSMAARREALLAALVEDTGRLGPSVAEVDAASVLVTRWAAMAPALLAEGPPGAISHPHVTAASQRVPYPLVGIITPWNSPLGLSLIDAIPALIAGCAVMVKPSEVTQRFIAPLEEAIAAVTVLAPVLRFVRGAADTGRALVNEVDAVCFTGSVTTGRQVAQQAANRLIPAFLELGGKDPAIVLKGADLDRAAGGICWSGTYNSGQLCHSIERVYVEAPVFEPFMARLLARMKTLTLARPGPADGQLGPFIDPRQAAIVERHIADALAKGARCLLGGEMLRDGARIWCQPTLLVDVTHDMAIMREETFGPVLPVMQVPNAETALRLANDSPYGLSASVWGPEAEALALARRLNAGGVSINDASLAAVLMDAEKNAFGESGLGGSRMGPAALTRFTRTKALLTSRIEGDDPWW